MARGYYEKKLAGLEKQLEGLIDQYQLMLSSEQEVEKVLISPFVLQQLIKEQDRKNRELLKAIERTGEKNDEVGETSILTGSYKE